jgi:hypothetical protein
MTFCPRILKIAFSILSTGTTESDFFISTPCSDSSEFRVSGFRGQKSDAEFRVQRSGLNLELATLNFCSKLPTSTKPHSGFLRSGVLDSYFHGSRFYKSELPAFLP